MKDRVAFVDDRQNGTPNKNARRIGQQFGLFFAKGVRHDGKQIALGHRLTFGAEGAQQPSRRGAEPMGRGADIGRAAGAGDALGGQHVLAAHDPQDPRKPRTHGHLVKAQPFARFIKQDRRALFCRDRAQRTVPQGRGQHHRRAEIHRHLLGYLVSGRDAHLRQVRAVDRRRMQIDTKVAAQHHLLQENMRQPRAKAARRRAGETAV